MNDSLNLNEFFVEGGNQETSHVLLHLTEPSTPEEKAKGYFFAVAELNHTPADIIAKVQALIDEIENAYYETPDDTDKTSLEVVVASFNAATTLKEETAGKLNCILGALRGDEILITYVGNPLAILCYRNRDHGYQRMNLLEGNDEADATGQLFEHFVQGKISAGDFVLVGTPHITDHFNIDRLEKIVTSRKAEDSAAHLERVLGDLRNGFSFGGLIINRAAPSLVETLKKPKAFEKDVSSGDSLKKLLSTEKHTSETLSPSFLPRVQDKFKQAVSPLRSRLEPEPPPTAPHVNTVPGRAQHLQPRYNRNATSSKTPINDVLKIIGRVIVKIFKALAVAFVYVFQFFWALIVVVARFFGSIFFIVTNWHNRRQTILENWSREWRARKDYIKHLPLLTKVLVVATFIGAVVLSVGVMVVRHNQTLAAERKQFNDYIASINLKRDAAESALIYRDEAKAQSELQSALAILASLPCTQKENILSCQELTKKLSDITVRLSKLSPVTPNVLASFDESPAPALTNLVRLGSKLVATSASSTRLYIYDILTHETKIVETGFVAGNFTFLTAPKENDYVVAVVNKRDIYLIDVADWHLKKIDITFPAPIGNITAASVYNRRLYTVDSGTNHLYKHEAIKNGFGPAKDWLLGSSTTLKGSVDLAIDGDMYILNTLGSVQKFSLGQNVDWSLPALTPALTSASRLFTYNDVENLYLLDSFSKRLIILRKSGELKAQLVNTAWLGPTDFAIDEPAYTAYVIDSNKLYKVDLPR